MTEKDYIKEYMKGGYTKSQAYLLAKNKMQQGGTTNGYANNQKPIARVLRNVETNEVKEGSLPPGYYTKVEYMDGSKDYLRKENEDMFHKMPNYIEFMKRQQQNNFAPNTQKSISMAEPTQSFQDGGWTSTPFTPKNPWEAGYVAPQAVAPTISTPIPNPFQTPQQPNDIFSTPKQMGNISNERAQWDSAWNKKYSTGMGITDPNSVLNYQTPITAVPTTPVDTQQTAVAQNSDYVNLSPEQLADTSPMADMSLYTSQEQKDRMSRNAIANVNNYDPNGNARQNTPSQNQKMQIFNPYGGVGLDQSLYMAGQGFGSKNYGQAAGAGALALLSGTRNFLSGFSSAKATRQEEEEQRKRQFEEQNNPIYLAQEGGTISNADILTGDYITEIPEQVNVEIEKDEVIKNAETGQIQKAVGETHENGGIKTNLPDGSQVLSDFTKIGKDNAKYIADQYDVKVQATDTFAKAMDKINKKIGIDELSKEEADYIKVVEKQEGVDKATADINSQFLAEEIEKIQVKKESLKPIQDGAFQELFNRQEMIPKKGNSVEVMKEGGYTEDVLNFAKKYNLHPDKIITLMQEGGETQQNQIVEAINEMLSQGMTPEQILEQLIAQGVPQEEAIQMVEAVVGQAQTPMMEEGGTQGEEKMTAEQKKQKLEDYFKQYTALGYTGKKDIVEIQKWAAKNYPDDVVNYYVKSGQPANAKHVDIIKQKHKDIFKTTGIDPNKPSASYTSEEKKILTDALGENATKEFWLEGFQDGLYDWRLPAISQAQNTTDLGYKAEMRTPTMPRMAGSGQEAPTTPDDSTTSSTTPDDSTTSSTTQTTARGVKTMLPLLPQDLLLPPGELASIYKGEANFGQLDPSKITPEPQLAEIERQRQSASNQAYFLPEAQRAAVLAQMLGTSQGASNEAIGKAEMFNAQQRQVADQFNLQTQAKEDLTNIDLNKDYERRSLAGQAMYETNLRRFLNKMNDVQRQNFEDVRDLNLADAAFDQYQTDGSNIYFTNPATFTVPQASGISQEQYDAMTPDQRKAFKAMYTQQNS